MSCTGRRIATLAMTAFEYRFVVADHGNPAVSMTWSLQVGAALWRPTRMAEG
jgi:hypothetical protein